MAWSICSYLKVLSWYSVGGLMITIQNSVTVSSTLSELELGVSQM